MNILFSLILSIAFANPLCTETEGASPLEDYQGIIWSKDLNSDDLEDVMIKGTDCYGTTCDAGIYLSCGTGRFYPILPRDQGLDQLEATNESSPLSPEWKILRIPRSKIKPETEPAAVIDLDHDGNDIASRERFANETKFRAEYQNSGLGSPGNLPGEYIFTGLQYERFYTESELAYLLRLVELGDSQAAHTLFYSVLRRPTDHPVYRKYQMRLETMEQIRKLFKTGFTVLPRNMEAEYLRDPLTLMYYLRANLANQNIETVQRLLTANPNLAVAVVKYTAGNISLLPETLRKNVRLTEEALKENRSAIAYVDESFLNDKKRIMSWCESYQISARHLSQSLLTDDEVADACIKARPINYQFFSTQIRADVNIARVALSNDGFMLKFAPAQIKSNLELVKIALERYPAGKEYVSKKILRMISSEKPKK